MDIRNRVAVVTGGASGIGRALALRFARDGAAGVVVADVDEAGAEEVAATIGGLAVRVDVSSEEEIRDLVARSANRFGRIDLFCSNAGIAYRGGVETPNEQWQRIWDVNVMAHVYAARAVLPGMLERGEGYLLNTASAAGLLSQVDSATYSVTKHAAVALAEWLSINHRDRGIRVSVLCPQAVRTQMTARGPGVAAVDGMIEPEEVADVVMDAIAEERFLILPHPQVQTYMERKVADYDRWLAGMRRLKDRFSAPD
jgi:NAD(P)-dependent dehydrogenase (short-subunit alcohol dehydrogenase family)